MEATGRRQGQRARLQSRPFRLYYRACLTFYYHMYGSDMGTLKVSLNGRLVWQLTGNQGNQWHIATVPIFLPGLKKVINLTQIGLFWFLMGGGEGERRMGKGVVLVGPTFTPQNCE
mgnify:CR=1 FL=1